MTDAAYDPAEEPRDPLDRSPEPRRAPRGDRPDLERAGELLGRTADFLERCTEDPKAAFEADDPDELRAGLDDLGPRPRRAAEDDDPPVERRRSA